MNLPDQNIMMASVEFVRKMKQKYAAEVSEPSDNLDMILRCCACADEDFFEEERRKANDFYYNVRLQDGRVRLVPTYELTALEALSPVDFENTPAGNTFVDGYSLLPTSACFPGKQQIFGTMETLDRWDMEYVFEEAEMAAGFCRRKMSPEETEKYRAHKLCPIGQTYQPFAAADFFCRWNFYEAMDPGFVDNEMPYSFGPSCPDRRLSEHTFSNIIRRMMIDLMLMLDSEGIKHENPEAFCMAASVALVNKLLEDGEEGALDREIELLVLLEEAEVKYAEFENSGHDMSNAADLCYLMMIWSIKSEIEPYDEKVYAYYRGYKTKPLENRENALAFYHSPEQIYGSGLSREEDPGQWRGDLEQQEQGPNEDHDVIKLEELEFSIRTYNVLKRAGINTLDDLLGKTYADLRQIRNLGRKSLYEVMAKMQEYGVVLEESEGADPDNP